MGESSWALREVLGPGREGGENWSGRGEQEKARERMLARPADSESQVVVSNKSQSHLLPGDHQRTSSQGREDEMRVPATRKSAVRPSSGFWILWYSAEPDWGPRPLLDLQQGHEARHARVGLVGGGRVEQRAAQLSAGRAQARIGSGSNALF